MITSIEIRNQRFNKSFRGYNQDEVKNCLNQIAQDYEALYSENSRLKDELQKVEYELQKYRKLEETMNNSLILAQQTAEELKAGARKEAQLILAESKKRISEILLIYQDVIKRINLYNMELKGQIMAELEMLEKNQTKVDDLAGFFYSEDVKNIISGIEKIKIEDHG
ncbi:MAG: DivIVA domain-containing protein [Syntrophomonadaceae bacterium]|jgi:cell division initiation protein